MSPSREIAAALDENTRAYILPCAVTSEGAGYRFTLHLTALDSVGVGLDSLEFQATDRTEWSSEELNAWGTRLADRVTYLLEPLKVLEIDAGGGEVQLRSQAPTPRNDRRSYYEVRLFRSGLLRLERIAFDEATRRRERAACHLTREVLERLANDIVASSK
ncbi:hypothetical protein OJF2_63610 [Aquisphaera giovannonii]|uniref:Uncharacterized protein n=1 Tax=Aquisphaera giovannonii TaxID=406548 RepID=A0A5B9WD12_9BACT|nr:hypothetical protein [Aquisphaera giovannonii]QEH37770.1 hypothetical protein OJF2_63610 [Aquisphaera giovannonii]